MRRKICLAIAFSFSCCIAYAQVQLTTRTVDSLKHELAIAKTDTGRVILISALCSSYHATNFDSLQVYSKRGLYLARQVGFPKGEVDIMCSLAGGLQLHGDMPKSLSLLFKALQIAQENHLTAQTVTCLDNIANAYWFLNDFPKSIVFYKRADQLNKTNPVLQEREVNTSNLILNTALAYLSLNQLDSAKICIDKLAGQKWTDPFEYSYYLLLHSQVLFKLGDHKRAFELSEEGIRLNDKNNDNYLNGDGCYFLAQFFRETGQPDSAIFYAKKGLAGSRAIKYQSGALENSKLLAALYEQKDINQAHYYLKQVLAINEELFGSGKVKELQKTLSEEEERQRQKEMEHVAYQTRLKEYCFAAGIVVLLLIAFILYRNNLREKKGKKQLQEKNEVIEKTLADLKSAQNQLVQREKMASLGELTAGIAHEIQNPLNFVNNFSEVSIELLQELKEEEEAGNKKDVLAIADDLVQNLEKINHHGKRADSIVKGMLEHSRVGTGEKQPTDLNALADEFLKLSYHGLRAKDKAFNAELINHFDEKLPKVNVVQQDIGRVLLNLFNNAFYAINQKAKTAGADYKPTVEVSTSAQNGQIEIRVKDNGNGIPENIKEKIMQPFFTTKPTGEGTGLGLSLSYDIVVKGHGGNVLVDTREGVFTEFIVMLPI